MSQDGDATIITHTHTRAHTHKGHSGFREHTSIPSSTRNVILEEFA